MSPQAGVSLLTSLVAEYIQLADATKDFRFPCISEPPVIPFIFSCVAFAVDLKVGRVTYDPLATAAKRHRESSKYPWQSELGFRITGMKIYDHKLRAYRKNQSGKINAKASIPNSKTRSSTILLNSSTGYATATINAVRP